MMSDLHDMIRISCEETITPETEAQLEHLARRATDSIQAKALRFQRNEEGSWGKVCEDAPCCGCCGEPIEDGYGSPADDAWHDAHEYPDW